MYPRQLTPTEIALLRSIVEGGGPKDDRENGVALARLIAGGFVLIRKTYVPTEAGRREAARD